MHRRLLLEWLFTDFEQLKKKKRSYFADFEQVKKLVVILLTLNKTEKLVDCIL